MNKSPYLELIKAQRLLQDEQGAYKILEHKEAKFQIQILDVFFNIDTKDEILVSSRRIDTLEERTMPLSVLYKYYA